MVTGPGLRACPEDIGDYVDLALVSGYPQAALTLQGLGRAAWLSSYVDQLVLRDVAALGTRNPSLLRRYVEALALNTAGVVTQATLLHASGINRATAATYEHDLSRTFALDIVQPRHSNRFNRLVKLPKRYLTDAALVAAVLGLNRSTLLGDGDLLGRMVDTFVAAQRCIQAGLGMPPLRLRHLRDRTADGKLTSSLRLRRASSRSR